MATIDKPNRRDFIRKSAGVAGSASVLVGLVPSARAQEPEPLEDGFKLLAPPLVENWPKQLGAVTHVNYDRDAPELKNPAVKERHSIYSYLLMKLIHRFWNGNKNGPIGLYPQRTDQREAGTPDRYRGDLNERSDRSHTRWDRYLGHNIACVAVDGLGHIIDFDFNHNAFFRSTAEHAESRLVRRLFSLTDVFDSWMAGRHINIKPHAAVLSQVTLYTSLESCAQCSGVMSLAGIKQIIYMQNDFTAYKIGNIMYNLANRADVKDDDGNVRNIPGAPVPIPASAIGLDEFFNALNKGNLDFSKKMLAGNEFFFRSSDGTIVDRDPSITSFLCTDEAYGIFERGGKKLDSLSLQFKDHRFPVQNPLPDDPAKRALTNAECLDEANEFFEYVDVEGYRGSPHKL
jgi:tRNA(Arg) A34 adenosine deaminase TadA